MALIKKERIVAYWSREAERYSGSHSSGIRAGFRKKETAINLKLLDLKPGEVVLDAGCGSGITSLILLGEERKVIGVDFSSRMIEEASRKGIDARVEDISEMNLPERFDKILASGVLEYVLDREKTIRNLLRHLKPKGKIVVVVPNFSFLGMAYFFYHLLRGMPVKLYSKKTLTNLFIKAGLEVVEIKTSNLALHMAGIKK